MRAALLALSLAGLSVGAWLSPPPTTSGCTREVLQYTAYLPHAVQLRLADAGFPITPTVTPYKRLRGRAWVCTTDAGTTIYPPRLSRLAEHFRPDLDSVPDPACSDATLCPAQDGNGDDGGADPLAEVAFECACAQTSTCLLTSDGGVAPHAVTLAPGTFTGAGCKPKSCGVLSRQRALPDGGIDYDESWPAACPIP